MVVRLTKVYKFHGQVRTYHDIVRLEIQMHNSIRLKKPKGFSDIADEPKLCPERQPLGI